jgi:type IV pilus assembly protein PilN
MSRINLVPFRAARKKENIRRQVSVFLLSVVLILILLVWYNYNLSQKIKVINNNIESTQKELNTYQEINKEIAEIKNKLKILKAKTEIIDKLQANRNEPVRILDKMTEMIVPKRMWFTHLNASERIFKDDTSTQKKRSGRKKKKEIKSKPETITILEIKGFALDNKTVADFMTRLESSNMFSNIDLKTVKQESIKGVNLKQFIVTLQKNPPEIVESKHSTKAIVPERNLGFFVKIKENENFNHRHTLSISRIKI